VYDFSKLKGKKVSILLEGLKNKKEAYVGHITSFKENFVTLKLLQNQTLDYPVDQIIIRADIIESVWIYK